MAKRKRLGPVDAFAASPAPEVKSAVPPIATVSGDAATRNALAEVTHMLESARAEGRLVQKLPIHEIESEHLIRDRLSVDDDEMTALKESLKARGQQTPIEVIDLGENRVSGQGRYGLVSGWRRLMALSSLRKREVLARVIRPGSEASAYEAMVEENEIRVGLSYYERARIVVQAVSAGIYPTKKKAQLALFAHASRAKRSKIGSFVTVVEALDGHLSHPTELGERMGLELAKALNQGRKDDLIAALVKGHQTAAEEQDSLRAAVSNTPKPSPRSKSISSANSGETGSKSDSDTGQPWLDIELCKGAQSVTLHGKGITPAFVTALEAWMATSR